MTTFVTKESLSLLVVVLALATGLPRSSQPSAVPPPYLEETLRSSVLDEPRRLLIRLPRGYELDG